MTLFVLFSAFLSVKDVLEGQVKLEIRKLVMNWETMVA